MKRKPKRVHRLPAVEYMTTTSVRKYIDSWRKIGMPVAKQFNCRLVGFDPDFLLAHRNGYSFNLPLWAALEFNKQEQEK